MIMQKSMNFIIGVIDDECKFSSSYTDVSACHNKNPTVYMNFP